MQDKVGPAIQYLEAALRQAPRYTKAWMNLGIAYYKVGEYRKAIETWQRLLQIDPGNEQAKNNILAARRML